MKRLNESNPGEVLEIAYHRNGVGGNGFYVIKFRHYNNPDTTMLAIYFSEDDKEITGNIAIIDMSLLYQGIIGAENKWRGDMYESFISEAVKTYQTNKLISIC